MSDTLSGQQVAKRLYYDSADLTFRARVTDIRLVATERREGSEPSQLWQVALDRTAFYPESGGQPWDTGVLVATARSGALLEVPVERVEEDKDGEVWHFVRKPLVEGTEIEGRVDPKRRMDHMQQHSGQHLLSAVLLRQMEARTVSFHLGAESATIDLEFAEEISRLDREDVVAAEAQANRLIFEDRALAPQWFSREQAEAMLARGELRKLPDRTGPIRIVEMRGVEWNACGGTHVPSTGSIGGLVVRRIEKVKRAWRVEFLCGLRMVERTRRDFELLSDAAARLTVGAEDVPARIAGLQSENKVSAKKLLAAQQELAEARAAELIRGGSGNGVIRAEFQEKPTEFAKRVASLIAASGFNAAVGVVESGRATVFAATRQGDDRNAGVLLREAASSFGGRGGGSAQMAQAVCEPSKLEEILRAVEKALG